MPVYSTRAIILRHTPDREHDRTLVVLTPDRGQQRIKAKGVRRSQSKLGGSLEPLMEVDLMVAEGRTMDRVTGSVILDRFAAIRTDPFAMVAAQWLLELVEAMTKPDQQEQGLYEALRQQLRSLPEEYDWTLGRRWLSCYRRAWYLIDHEGFWPAMDRCVACSRPLTGPSVFRLGQGLLHEDEQRVGDSRVSQAARDYLLTGTEPADLRGVFQEVQHLVEQVTHQVLDRPLKSDHVLRSFVKLEQLSA